MNIVFVLAFFTSLSYSAVEIIEPDSLSDPSFRRKIVTADPIPFITITAVGDLMMSSWLINVVKEKGVDYPFDSTRTILQSSDFTIANLEAPLTETGTAYKDKSFIFKVPPYFVAGIKRSGINVVNLANNHILDFGPEGLQRTIAVLDSSGIYHAGADSNRHSACEATIVDYFGVKVAFLGFSMTFPKAFWATKNSSGTCYPDEALLYQMLRKAEEEADLTIASFHWGAEAQETPKDYQIYFARKAIDFGADLVLGHHPHVLQGLQLYKNRLIAYSLGNFVFASYSEHAKDSIILKARISPSGLLSANVFPISVYNVSVNFQPRLHSGKKRKMVLDYLNNISKQLNGQDILSPDGTILK